MTAPTRPMPALVKEIHAALARLRLARAIGDDMEARRSERRLNWLIDQLPKCHQ